jgi:hypothetical protein
MSPRTRTPAPTTQRPITPTTPRPTAPRPTSRGTRRATPSGATPATSSTPDPDATLLQLAGKISGEHALIIGGNAVELMCGLIRQGAAEVQLLRPGVRPERASADLAVATDLATPDQLSSVMTHARRALAESGRVILRTTADPTGSMARLVAQTLRLHGFSAVRARRAGDRSLVTATLPWFGPLASA